MRERERERERQTERQRDRGREKLINKKGTYEHKILYLTVEIDDENSFITQRVELNAWFCCNDTDSSVFAFALVCLPCSLSPTDA